MTPTSHGRSGRPWRRLREQILARDGYRCMIRGPKCKGLATTVDHIVALLLAPHLAHEPSNLRAACRSCNSSLGAKLGNPRRTTPAPKWVKPKPWLDFKRPER